MKKLIIALSVILVILVIVFTILVQKKLVVLPSLSPPSPTASITPRVIQETTIFPESLLPTPESLAPPEDPNTYENQPPEQQEFGALMVTLPINTADSMVYFNFSNSIFEVTVFSDEGMQEYEALRRKYPNIKDESFKVLDQRFGL